MLTLIGSIFRAFIQSYCIFIQSTTKWFSMIIFFSTLVFMVCGHNMLVLLVSFLEVLIVIVLNNIHREFHFSWMDTWVSVQDAEWENINVLKVSCFHLIFYIYYWETKHTHQSTYSHSIYIVNCLQDFHYAMGCAAIRICFLIANWFDDPLVASRIYNHLDSRQNLTT